MSRIFFPYVYHGSVSHQYYFNLRYRDISDCKLKNFSAKFSSGIREVYENEFESAYLRLLDQLLLYDTCMIPVEDLIYLVLTLGYDDTIKIIQSSGIELYDALSTKIGSYFDQNNSIGIFSDKQSENTDEISNRIDNALKPLNQSNIFNEKWRENIIKLFREAFFINDAKHLLKLTKKDFFDDYIKPDIKNILKLSSSITHLNLNEEQIKTNRLLHFHYYKRIAKLLNCDYIFIPVELQELYDYYASEVSISKNNLDSIFSEIIKIESIPDIPKLFLEGILNVDDILEIRNSKEGIKFRKWLNELGRLDLNIKDDPNIYTKLYHEACLSNNSFKKAYNSKTGSAVRSIGLFSIGSLNNAFGAGLTAIDYFVSNNFNDFNPGNFTREKLREIMNKKTN